MRNKHLVFALLIAFTVSASVSAQSESSTATDSKASNASLPSAKEIFAAYVAAIGGRESALKIKSRVLKGKALIAQANISGTVESYSKPDAMTATIIRFLMV